MAVEGSTPRDPDVKTVTALLRDVHRDEVYAVEDDVVWVSGMNANCHGVARRLARTLIKEDIPCSLIYDDDADQFGGVVFRYGGDA